MQLVVGVDVQKLEHVAAAVDETGRCCGQLRFTNTAGELTVSSVG